jgi:hypothetical protein
VWLYLTFKVNSNDFSTILFEIEQNQYRELKAGLRKFLPVAENGSKFQLQTRWAPKQQEFDTQFG